ncbi:MAG: SDR family NAD(P)-dependent oxidoreductase [Verrucomicrobia bacterium]|nr:SDR family NAD(P)-dependent oxidoreductase [Verrucomicrobiota bacterium]
MGSVKTNIGHSEAAAGIAGVLKVLLMMKHRVIPGNAHLNEPNPYLEIEGSPFYLVRETSTWMPDEGGDANSTPRRAGVSSFGVGGTNAHVILEEYLEKPEDQVTWGLNSVSPILIILSGKNRDRLREYAVRLLKHIESKNSLNGNTDQYLRNLAYTLQVGRDAMECRLAMVVHSMREAKEKLQGFIEGCPDIQDLHQGQVPREEESTTLIVPDESLERDIESWIGESDYDQLLRLWVKGLVFDWNRLYRSERPCRISAPTYPFSRERCWIGKDDSSESGGDSSGETIPLSPHLADCPNRLIYLPRWDECPLDISSLGLGKPDVVVLVFTALPSRFEEVLAEGLQEKYAESTIVQISLGNRTQNVSDDKWTCDVNDVRGFESCLKEYAIPDVLYFLSGCREEGALLDCDFVSTSQVYNEIQLLRLVQWFAKSKPIDAPIDCYVLTIDNHRIGNSLSRSFGGGLTGLAYAIAQASHWFRVRNIDLSALDLIESQKQETSLRMIFSEVPSDRGEAIKFWSGRRYRQRFIEVNEASFSMEPAIEHGGVYVIAGGGGTVGRIISRHLIRNYEASVIWIGRPPEDSSTIQQRLSSFRDCGDVPWYLQADVTDMDSVKLAVKKLKERHPKVNGALFLAIVFSPDNSALETSEEEFLAVLDVKSKGSLNFYRAFESEPLDFLCFFSSSQAFSFSGASKFSAYASGICASDSLILSLQKDAPFPLGIINWGFWGSSVENSMLGSHLGVLSDEEGIQCFERIVALLKSGFVGQALCLKAMGPVQEIMELDRGECVEMALKGSVDHFQTIDQKFQSIEVSDETQNFDSKEFDLWLARLLSAEMRRLEATAPIGSVIGQYVPWKQEALRRLTDFGLGIASLDQDVLGQWELKRKAYLRDPVARARLELVEDCLQSLVDVLLGRVQATDILFSESSLERVKRVYKNNPCSDYYNRILGDLVGSYATVRIESDQGKIRIIEIGGGTGGLTSVVLPRLRPFFDSIEEYHFTDQSHAFLKHAEKGFGLAYPFLSYGLFDIEKPLRNQGVEVGAYDMVFAGNVLHATRDIRETLRNAKAALRQNGVLLLAEMSAATLFDHVTFGLLDGWWRPEDTSLRMPGSPGISPEVWRELLEAEGFKNICFPAENGHHLGQQIIVALSDGVVRQRQSEIETKPIPKPGEQLVAIGEANDGAENFSLLTGQVSDLIVEALSQSIKIAKGKIDRTIPFSDYGIDSILGVQFIKRIGKELGIRLNTAVIFDHTTVERLGSHILNTYSGQIESRRIAITKPGSTKLDPSRPFIHQQARKGVDQISNPSKNDSIAVVGMSGQFPGAKNVDSFWENLIG